MTQYDVVLYRKMTQYNNIESNIVRYKVLTSKRCMCRTMTFGSRAAVEVEEEEEEGGEEGEEEEGEEGEGEVVLCVLLTDDDRGG